ncbi:hypothetical protein GCM10027074_13220 [Streptomyces deserti]
MDYQITAAGHPDWTRPQVLDRDVVGTVDAVGPEVTGVRPGQRVACPATCAARAAPPSTPWPTP